MDDKKEPLFMSVADMMEEHKRDPYKWERSILESLKHWRYDPESKRLCMIEWDYTVPLNRCNSNAAIVDWVCQLARKTQLSAEIVGEFVIAINALLTPQAHMCGGGIDRGKVDAESIAEGRYATMIEGNPDSVLVTRLKERP